MITKNQMLRKRTQNEPKTNPIVVIRPCAHCIFVKLKGLPRICEPINAWLTVKSKIAVIAPTKNESMTKWLAARFNFKISLSIFELLYQ